MGVGGEGGNEKLENFKKMRIHRLLETSRLNLAPGRLEGKKKNRHMTVCFPSPSSTHGGRSTRCTYGKQSRRLSFQ